LPYYFRVAAVNAGGESKPTEVVTALPSGGAKQVLIVNGFDRFDRTQNFRYDYYSPAGNQVDRVWPRYNNSFDYVVQYHTAINAAKPGTRVDSTSNEAVVSGAVNLNDYDIVMWILGNESTADDTFNATEQTKVAQFLAGGGNLFVSGSEIGWDLDQQNNGRTFYQNTLQANYVADDAATYTATAAAGGIFDGMNSFVFSSGSPSTGASAYSSRDTQLYNVAFPDVIAPLAGATVALNYHNGAGAAAIQMQGTGGAGSLVMFGFPFETMTDATRRQNAIGRILDFFAPTPAVTIEMQVNFDNADAPPGPTLAAGDTANFLYTVTNGGAIPLADVVVQEDNGTPAKAADDFSPTLVFGDLNINNVLDVDEVWVYTATRTVPAGQVTSTGSVAALGDGQPVAASDPANYFGSAPGIAVQSLVNGDDANSPPGSTLVAGSPANFTYIVANTGNVPLANVTVTDDNGTPGTPADDFVAVYVSGDANANSMLDIGEEWTFSAARVGMLGQYTGTATATGVDSISQSRWSSDAANYIGVPGANADFDASGAVDGADFLAWQRGFGLTSGAAAADGDANGDQMVDAADLAFWSAGFGESSTLSSTSTLMARAATAASEESIEPAGEPRFGANGFVTAPPGDPLARAGQPARRPAPREEFRPGSMSALKPDWLVVGSAVFGEGLDQFDSDLGAGRCAEWGGDLVDAAVADLWEGL
jgi:hypothetical protein